MTEEVQQQSQPPKGLVLTFVGPIQPAATKNLRKACCMAINQKAKKLTILFSSLGGSIDDGFALYGFLRALPVELTIHAIGSVESIATVVFLAADKRLATPQAHFMIHGFTWPFVAQPYEQRQIEDTQESLKHSLAKYTKVLEERTLLTQQALDQLNAFKKINILTPAFAKEKGIIQQIADATIPAGWITYNVDF